MPGPSVFAVNFMPGTLIERACLYQGSAGSLCKRTTPGVFGQHLRWVGQHIGQHLPARVAFVKTEAESSRVWLSGRCDRGQPTPGAFRSAPVRLCCALADLSSTLTPSGVIADTRGLITMRHLCKGERSSPHEEQEQMCHTRFGA